ncbi:hypothetical protein Tco_0339488, partial [Tanacetum coccineum]
GIAVVRERLKKASLVCVIWLCLSVSFSAYSNFDGHQKVVSGIALPVGSDFIWTVKTRQFGISNLDRLIFSH